MLLFLCSTLVYGLFEFIRYKQNWQTFSDTFCDSLEDSYSHTYTGYLIGNALGIGLFIGLTIGTAIGAWIWSNSIWHAVAIIAGAVTGAQVAQAIVNRFYDPLEELPKTFEYKE